MKISIVIATFNRRQPLEKCLASILNQTFADYEIIIVDDGSIDDTKEYLLQNYSNDKRFKLFFLGENQGVDKARNKGLDKAQGEYVIVWDSDDELYPSALKELYSCAEKYPQAVIIYAPADFYSGDKKKEFPVRESGLVDFPIIASEQLPKNTKLDLVKRTYLKDIRFYAPNIDFSYYLTLAHQGICFYLNRCLGKVYLLSDQFSETAKRRRPNASLSIIRAQGLQTFIRRIGQDFKKYAPERYGRCSYGAAVGLLLAGEKKQAIFFIKEANNIFANNYYRLFFFFSLMPFSSYLLRLAFCVKNFFHQKSTMS